MGEDSIFFVGVASRVFLRRIFREIRVRLLVGGRILIFGLISCYICLLSCRRRQPVDAHISCFHELAVKLATLGWRKARLAEVRAEILACQQYLNAFRSKTSHMEKLLSNREYCDLLGVHDKSVEQWKKEPFSTNPSYPENLKFKTNAGTLVRSKSELLIAMTLEKYGVPYRYECLLETPSGPCFPDFTIMHPRTHKIFLWEHFGLMDNSSYAANAGTKVCTYLQMGYVPGDTFLMTYETSNRPLDLQEVENLIRGKFT